MRTAQRRSQTSMTKRDSNPRQRDPYRMAVSMCALSHRNLEQESSALQMSLDRAASLEEFHYVIFFICIRRSKPPVRGCTKAKHQFRRSFGSTNYLKLFFFHYYHKLLVSSKDRIRIILSFKVGQMER